MVLKSTKCGWHANFHGRRAATMSAAPCIMIRISHLEGSMTRSLGTKTRGWGSATAVDTLVNLDLDARHASTAKPHTAARQMWEADTPGPHNGPR
eukprot:351841-Chlamydomonas_euryale.AAC.20